MPRKIEEITELYLLKKILKNQEKIMAALDDANANLTKLNTDLDAFIANQPTGGATEAQVQTLADGIAAADAKIPKP